MLDTLIVPFSLLPSSNTYESSSETCWLYCISLWTVIASMSEGTLLVTVHCLLCIGSCSIRLSRVRRNSTGAGSSSSVGGSGSGGGTGQSGINQRFLLSGFQSPRAQLPAHRASQQTNSTDKMPDSKQPSIHLDMIRLNVTCKWSVFLLFKGQIHNKKQYRIYR